MNARRSSGSPQIALSRASKRGPRSSLPSARAVHRCEWKNRGSRFLTCPQVLSLTCPMTCPQVLSRDRVRLKEHGHRPTRRHAHTPIRRYADTPIPRSFQDALASWTKHSIIHYAKTVRVIRLGVSRSCPGAGCRSAAKFIAITRGAGPATGRCKLQCDRCCSISRWAAGIGGITSGRVDERTPLDGPLQRAECRVLPT